MTTSSPVVPRLEAAIQQDTRRSHVASRKHWFVPRFGLWPISDALTITLIVMFLRRSPFFSVSGRVDAFSLSMPALSITAAGIFIFWCLNVYTPLPSPLDVYETEQILRGTGIVAVVIAMFLSQGDLRVAFGTPLVAGLLTPVLLMQRALLRELLPFRGSPIRALIYARDADADLLRAIHTASGSRLKIVGLISDNSWELVREAGVSCHHVGTFDELDQVAKLTGASHVLVVGDGPKGEAERVLQKCQRLKLRGCIVLDPREFLGIRPTCTFMHDIPVFHEPASTARASFQQLKRALDVVVGSLLLLLATPAGVVIAAAIVCDSRGPILFRQQRIGKDGQPFRLLKFRSMHTWSPKYHRSPTSDSDRRITRVGRLLRRSSLDELPQLINVIKGDMSLVGPRPEMPFIVDQYNEAARWRLAVRPGITGLWQISRARSLPIHHSLQYDIFYVEHQNIFLDAAILVRTIGAVVRGVGAA